MTGLVTEGRSDKKALNEICRKVGINTSIRKIDGNNLKRGKRLADLLLSHGCKKVVLLKDLHNYTCSHIKTKFAKTKFSNKVKLCIVVRAIESWLLADEKALSDYLGTKVKRVHNPEDISKPDELLDDIFKNAKGRGYVKGGEDPAEIAKRLRLTVVEKRCPSFKEFMTAVQS